MDNREMRRGGMDYLGRGEGILLEITVLEALKRKKLREHESKHEKKGK